MVSVLFCGSRSFSSFSVVLGPDFGWLASGGGVVCGSSAGADALVVRAALAAGGAVKGPVFVPIINREQG